MVGALLKSLFQMTELHKGSNENVTKTDEYEWVWPITQWVVIGSTIYR